MAKPQVVPTEAAQRIVLDVLRTARNRCNAKHERSFGPCRVLSYALWDFATKWDRVLYSSEDDQRKDN